MSLVSLRTLTCCLFFGILLLFVFGLNFQGKKLLLAKEGLGAASCRKMHYHQMRVLARNPSHPFVKSLNLKAGDLKGRPPETSSLAFCSRYLSRANYACQMRAKTIPNLMACYQKYSREYRRGYADVKQNPLPKDSRSKKQGQSKISDMELPDYHKDLEDAPTANSNIEVLKTEKLPQTAIPVTQKNCGRAYQRMLDLLTRAPDLKKLTNHRQLVADWQSKKARHSFQQRCLAKFQPDDLGCIIEAKDREVLQACLLVIPG